MSTVRPSHLKLVVESGPDLGEEYTFVAGDEFVIGRGQYSNIVVDDKQASRKHAMIVSDGGELLLSDLDSRNGTYVNGERVAKRTLLNQDVIEIADLRLRAVYVKRGLRAAVPRAPRPRGSRDADSNATLANLHSGPLAPGALLELIKSLQLSKLTGCLTVRAVWGRGRILFQDGRLLTASIDCFPDISSRKAVQRLLRTQMGTMQFHRCDVEAGEDRLDNDIDAIHDEDFDYEEEFVRFIQLAPSMAADVNVIESDCDEALEGTEGAILELVRKTGSPAKIIDLFPGSDTQAMKTLSDLIEQGRVGF